MNPEMPAVLMLSLAEEIFGQKTCDTRKRHMEYAENLHSLHMIVFAQKHQSARLFKSGNLFVYPCISYTKLDFIIHCIILGARIIQNRRIDVITTQGPFITGLCGVILGKIFGIPVDMQNHSNFIDNKKLIHEKYLQNTCLNIMAKWLIPFADTHRVLNRDEKRKYCEYGIDSARIQIITTPVNETFSEYTDSFREKIVPADKSFVMIWVGRCIPCKNIPLLLKAVAELTKKYSDIFLILAGDGELKEKWKNMAESLHVSEYVFFAGNVSHDTLAGYYRAADVYVHPSYYEGYGKTMVEASFCKLPVVACDTSGAREIIQNGKNGFIVPQTVSGLINAIEHLYLNRKLMGEMGEAAYRHAKENFSRKAVVNQVCESFRRCAAYSLRYWKKI